MSDDKAPRTEPIQSWTFSKEVNAEIRRAAATGIYDIRGGGAKRRVPHFDDLLFLGASMSRYPLEGYRERCDTNVTLGTRFAENPIKLDIPIINNTLQHLREIIENFGINTLALNGLKLFNGIFIVMQVWQGYRLIV